ncbi:hypothetical protein [Psychromicrobium lacuslunae]|uniref:Uncharacterized protein n=1 Tax=Psychromicrobium lacuslunae TaxID=1618207 RepID=A0A0D4C0G6_9MICC|nr:hypothetical protein [Psychromicrobium lacuslunae]AJT42068.1 hypothetical protein UM93_12145 [Psychromicrobium lacuslunae]
MKKRIGTTAGPLIYGIVLLALGPAAFVIGVLGSMSANTSSYSGAADGWRFLALLGALAALAGVGCLCYGVWKAGRKLDALYTQAFGSESADQKTEVPGRPGAAQDGSSQHDGPENPAR